MNGKNTRELQDGSLKTVAEQPVALLSLQGRSTAAPRHERVDSLPALRAKHLNGDLLGGCIPRALPVGHSALPAYLLPAAGSATTCALISIQVSNGAQLHGSEADHSMEIASQLVMEMGA